MTSRIVPVLLALLLGVPNVTGPAWAQSPAVPKSEESAVDSLRAEMERVKSELYGVRTELRLLREVLQQRLAQPAPSQPPTRAVAKVAVGDNPMLGMKDAPVTLIEFSDYQCPFCRQFFHTTLAALKKEFIDSGKVRYVFRDFPIDQIHPDARKAAEAARCAGKEGKYWEMHDLLFQNQQALYPEHLKMHAARLQLDAAAFGACLDGGEYTALVQQNFTEGAAAGVRGTPAFFLGRTRDNGTIDGVLITGAQSFNDFRQEIERVLAEK